MAEQALTLCFPQQLVVAGQTIHGEVQLHFPAVQTDEIEEVHVKLRGSVYTKITTGTDKDSSTHRQREWLVRQSVSIWTRGSSYPPPDSHTLYYPFRFTLPENLPPSCKHDGISVDGSVGYLIEMVGVRPGMLQTNRRLVLPLSLVPADPVGAQIRLALERGWNGSWTTISAEENIRRGLWGGYANVKMELDFPSVQLLPLFTPVAFSLRIVTLTKEMKHEDTPRDPNEPIFPAPPIDPTKVEFVLRRHVHIRAHGYTRNDRSRGIPLGGMGEEGGQASQNVNIQVREKKWIPSEKDKRKGSWMQETIMRSAIVLRSTPTFSCPTFSLKHYMHIKVEFPGVGNNLKADIPIEVGSGLLLPPLVLASQDARVPTYSRPAQSLDLPPSYWAATEWGQDEKN